MKKLILIIICMIGLLIIQPATVSAKTFHSTYQQTHTRSYGSSFKHGVAHGGGFAVGHYAINSVLGSRSNNPTNHFSGLNLLLIGLILIVLYKLYKERHRT